MKVFFTFIVNSFNAAVLQDTKNLVSLVLCPRFLPIDFQYINMFNLIAFLMQNH